MAYPVLTAILEANGAALNNAGQDEGVRADNAIGCQAERLRYPYISGQTRGTLRRVAMTQSDYRHPLLKAHHTHQTRTTTKKLRCKLYTTPFANTSRRAKRNPRLTLALDHRNHRLHLPTLIQATRLRAFHQLRTQHARTRPQPTPYRRHHIRPLYIPPIKPCVNSQNVPNAPCVPHTDTPAPARLRVRTRTATRIPTINWLSALVPRTPRIPATLIVRMRKACGVEFRTCRCCSSAS
jgi:hypothetical protein